MSGSSPPAQVSKPSACLVANADTTSTLPSHRIALAQHEEAATTPETAQPLDRDGTVDDKIPSLGALLYAYIPQHLLIQAVFTEPESIEQTKENVDSVPASKQTSTSKRPPVTIHKVLDEDKPGTLVWVH